MQNCVTDPEICDCDCGHGENSNQSELRLNKVHIMPCCELCEICNQYIKLGLLDAHKKRHEENQEKTKISYNRLW